MSRSSRQSSSAESRDAEISGSRLPKVMNSQKIRGADDMKIMAYELNNTVNHKMRKGGYSCSQWVFGKLPRRAD
eukprot:4207814-Karenia_brevis.AAC.1